MKSFGFTLVELLGVIVILGVLITIITVSVGGVLDNSESKLTEIQVEKLVEAAKSYYISEGMEDSDFETNNFSHCVSANYLIENGYIDANEVSNFETGEDMIGSIWISYNSKKYEYTYVENSCQICFPVTEETKTTGNIPNGEFLVGDEYICEVKKDTKYHFFVVSEEDDKVNLILDRNINSDGTLATKAITTPENGIYNLTSWQSSGVASDGPTTAIDFLNKATKDWTNIENLNEIYEDENIIYSSQQKGTSGYGSIELKGKARLPKYSEVHGIGKCLIYRENDSKNGSCPLWLANYLHYSSSVKGEGIKNLTDIKGYWTLSSFEATSAGTSSWKVTHQGAVYSGNVDSLETGVRPVISLEKYKTNDRW